MRGRYGVFHVWMGGDVSCSGRCCGVSRILRAGWSCRRVRQALVRGVSHTFRGKQFARADPRPAATVSGNWGACSKFPCKICSARGSSSLSLSASMTIPRLRSRARRKPRSSLLATTGVFPPRRRMRTGTSGSAARPICDSLRICDSPGTGLEDAHYDRRAGPDPWLRQIAPLDSRLRRSAHSLLPLLVLPKLHGPLLMG